MKIFFARTDMYGGLIEGGTFSLMYGFLNGINQLGHSSFMLSSGPMRVPSETQLHIIPYSPYFWNVPELPTIPYSYRFVRRVTPLVEREQPDFLYLRHSAFNIAGALTKKKLGIKVLLQCDSSEVWIKKNWGTNYFPHLLRWAEEIEIASADGLTVISEEVKTQLVGMGADTNKILVNPNGVDTEMFSPDKSGAALRKHYGLEESFVCGFSGSFDIYHGVDVLARAMRSIKASIPSAKFLFIGDGKMRRPVEDIIRQSRLENDTIFTGYIPYARVPEHLAVCDALFVPVVPNSDGSEFFCSPIKLFEYMAMQKPIVASAVGQLRSVLQHNTNALLVPPNDPDALAEQTIRIFQSPDLARNIATQAREDAIRNYTWTMNAQRVIDFATSL